MPNSCTFTIKPIQQLVQRYISQSNLSVDPFARNTQLASYTNDLNPDTSAHYHLEAYEFLAQLLEAHIRPDLILFDPPYSRNQVKEVYNSIGRHYGIEDSKRHSANWQLERDIIHEILIPGGYVISCGWNSSGMGKVRGYEIIELLLVNHGGAHNDTIVSVERKLNG